MKTNILAILLLATATMLMSCEDTFSDMTSKKDVETLQKHAGRTFVNLNVAATLDPDSSESWLISGVVFFEDGVATFALTPDLKPVEGSVCWWEGINDPALNSAFYIERQKQWYPTIASDQNHCMEWSLCGIQGGRCVGILSYIDADDCDNFAFGATQENGNHSVFLDGFTKENDAASKTLTILYQGQKVCSIYYGGIPALLE